MKKWLHILSCALILLLITGCGKGNKVEKEKEYEIQTYASAEDGLVPYRVYPIDKQTLFVYGKNHTYNSGIFKVDLKHSTTTLITELRDTVEVCFTENGFFWLELKGMDALAEEHETQKEKNNEQSNQDEEKNYYEKLNNLNSNLMFLEYEQSKPEVFIGPTENIQVKNFNVASINELHVNFYDKKENNYFNMAVNIETKKSKEIKGDSLTLYTMENSNEIITVDDNREKLTIRNTDNDKEKILNMKYQSKTYYDSVSYLENNLLFFKTSFSNVNDSNIDDSMKKSIELYDFEKKKAKDVIFEGIDLQKVRVVDTIKNYVVVTYQINDDKEEKSSLQKFENGTFKQVQIDELENGTYSLIHRDEDNEWIFFDYDSESQEKQWIIIELKGEEK